MTSKATRKLARKLNRPPVSTRNAPTAPWVVASVTAVSLSTASITVQMQGDATSIAGINYIDSYTPVVGDICILHRQGGHLWAFGTVAAYSGGAASGWSAPSLFSNVATGTGTNQPVMQRLVADNGNLKVQLKGAVTVSTGYGNLWTVGTATAFSPAFNRLIPIVGPGGGIVYLNIAASTGNVSMPGVTATGSVSLDGIEYFIN